MKPSTLDIFRFYKNCYTSHHYGKEKWNERLIHDAFKLLTRWRQQGCIFSISWSKTENNLIQKLLINAEQQLFYFQSQVWRLNLLNTSDHLKLSLLTWSLICHLSASVWVDGRSSSSSLSSASWLGLLSKRELHDDNSPSVSVWVSMDGEGREDYCFSKWLLFSRLLLQAAYLEPLHLSARGQGTKGGGVHIAGSQTLVPPREKEIKRPTPPLRTPPQGTTSHLRTSSF